MIKLSTKFYQATFILLLIVIEYLATTTIDMPSISTGWDKLNHFLAFSTLAIVGMFGYKKYTFIIVGLLAFGIQIEVVQGFIPNREMSLLDIFADSVGILIGLVLHKILYNFRVFD